MKRFAYTFVLTFIVTGMAGAQQPAPSGVPPVSAATPIPVPEKRWEKFSPPGVGFTVLMPGPITTQDQVVDPAAKSPNRMSYVELDGDVFMVSYMQFPEPVTEAATIKEILDRARDDAVAATKATLKSESEISLDGYSGRQWLLSLPDGIKATNKAFWVSNTFYQLMVATKEEQTPAAAKLMNERTIKFFDSFTLVKPASK